MPKARATDVVGQHFRASLDALVEELREAGAGAQVDVAIVRDRRSTTLKATLEPEARRPAPRRGRPA